MSAGTVAGEGTVPQETPATEEEWAALQISKTKREKAEVSSVLNEVVGFAEKLDEFKTRIDVESALDAIVKSVIERVDEVTCVGRERIRVMVSFVLDGRLEAASARSATLPYLSSPPTAFPRTTGISGSPLCGRCVSAINALEWRAAIAHRKCGRHRW